MVFHHLKLNLIIVSLFTFFASAAFSIETGKVIKLVASSSENREKIAKTAYFERIDTGDCDGAHELLFKLKPLVDIFELSKNHFVLCEQSTGAIAESFSKLEEAELKRTANMLRIRLDISKDKEAFSQNSLLTVKFNTSFARRYTHYSSNVRLLLNAGRVKEAKEEFLLKYGKHPNPEYAQTEELLKIAESNPEFVSGTSFMTNAPNRKDLYLMGVREWLKKYPESLTANWYLKELLTRYNYIYTKEELAEFYRYRNERAFPFLTKSVSDTCLKNMALSVSSIAAKVQIVSIETTLIESEDGWAWETCGLVDPDSRDMLYLGAFVSRESEVHELGVLPYYSDGWHGSEFYNSIKPVMSFVSSNKDVWLVEKRSLDVEGEVGARNTFYSVYRLMRSGPEKVDGFKGYWSGDGGELWIKEYTFSFDATGRLLAKEIYTNTEPVTDKINQDRIEEKVYRWEDSSFAQISTATDSRIFMDVYSEAGPVRKPVKITVTGDIYKSLSLTDPMPVENREVVLLSRMRGVIEPSASVILKISPVDKPDEVWYMRPELAGEIGSRLGRSQ